MLVRYVDSVSEVEMEREANNTVRPKKTQSIENKKKLKTQSESIWFNPE